MKTGFVADGDGDNKYYIHPCLSGESLN